MTIVWFFYNLTMFLGFFLYWPWAALKGKRPATFGQRMGAVPAELAERLAGHPVLWIHAVSVGETQAVQLFLRRIKAQYPDWRISLTTVTSTGQRIAQQMLGSDDVVTYLPLDLPWAVHRQIGRAH